MGLSEKRLKEIENLYYDGNAFVTQELIAEVRRLRAEIEKLTAKMNEMGRDYIRIYDEKLALSLLLRAAKEKLLRWNMTIDSDELLTSIGAVLGEP